MKVKEVLLNTEKYDYGYTDKSEMFPVFFFLVVIKFVCWFSFKVLLCGKYSEEIFIFSFIILY